MDTSPTSHQDPRGVRPLPVPDPASSRLPWEQTDRPDTSSPWPPGPAAMNSDKTRNGQKREGGSGLVLGQLTGLCPVLCTQLSQAREPSAPTGRAKLETSTRCGNRPAAERAQEQRAGGTLQMASTGSGGPSGPLAPHTYTPPPKSAPPRLTEGPVLMPDATHTRPILHAQ